MKNLKNLGKTLNKSQQKEIHGGWFTVSNCPAGHETEQICNGCLGECIDNFNGVPQCFNCLTPIVDHK